MPTQMPSAARRPSYGAHSPNVGERGTRTRAHIVASALQQFEERGFHATLVDDIAQAAHVSRATLYQYFESKEQLFVEVVERSGAELIAAVERIGPLGPDADGFAEMRAWVEEWTAVFERYTPVFVQWANVDSTGAPLRRELGRFLDAHTRRLARHLDAAGGVDDPLATAVLMLAALERGHYVRYLHNPGRQRRDAFVVDAAIALQLLAFPTTPLAVVTPSVQPAHRAPLQRPRPDLDTFVPEGSRLDGLTAQGRRTAARLVAAGATVFARQGFSATNVDQIVLEAGVARGTFYKYFDDKLGVMLAASFTAIRELVAAMDDLGDPSPVEIAGWLDRFLALQRTHLGVLRAWTERIPDHPLLSAMSNASGDAMLAAYGRLVAATGGRPAVSPRSGYLLLVGVLEHFPARASGTRYELTDQQIVAAEARLLHRALLRPT